MERLELRQRMVTYCDVCGQEITGSWVSMNHPEWGPLHACGDYNEAIDGRCSDSLHDVAVGARPRAEPQLAGCPAIPDELQARCREILQWQNTGLLVGTALQAYAQKHWGEERQALQLAESDTVRELLHLVTAAAPCPIPQVPLESVKPDEETGSV